MWTEGRDSSYAVVKVLVKPHARVLEDKVESVIGFTVHPADIYGTGYLLTREDGVAALDVSTCIEPHRALPAFAEVDYE
jgi:hypothetical protein